MNGLCFKYLVANEGYYCSWMNTTMYLAQCDSVNIPSVFGRRVNSIMFVSVRIFSVFFGFLVLSVFFVIHL